MRTFHTYCGFDLWQGILDGHVDPTLERRNWDEKYKKAHALNIKSMNALICALSETVCQLQTYTPKNLQVLVYATKLKLIFKAFPTMDRSETCYPTSF